MLPIHPTVRPWSAHVLRQRIAKQATRQARGCLFGLLCLLATVGCKGPLTFVVGVTPGDQTLAPTVVQQAAPKTDDQIALIDVSGVIMNASAPGMFRRGENPVSLLQEQLNQAALDEDTKAVILRINSPGGGVTASETMNRMVQRFKAQTNKPVLALCMDVTASGGYYLACSADEIIAHPSSVVGSIGVIMQMVQFEQALNRLGIQTDAIVSGPNKAASSPLSTMQPEQREVLQGMVDDFYQDFVHVVTTARHGQAADANTDVFDGRVFSGRQALEVGLVDGLGDMQDALVKACQMADIERANLVLYHRPLVHTATPYSPAAQAQANAQSTAQSAMPNVQQQINLVNVAMAGSSWPLNPAPGFYYLWTGGVQ